MSHAQVSFVNPILGGVQGQAVTLRGPTGGLHLIVDRESPLGQAAVGDEFEDYEATSTVERGNAPGSLSKLPDIQHTDRYKRIRVADRTDTGRAIALDLEVVEEWA